MVPAADTVIVQAWQWSDGSRAATRVISQARYRTANGVPRLVVHTIPATPGRTVTLQSAGSQGWVEEDSAVTDAFGVASVSPYPLCEADQWCRGPVHYRLTSGGEHADLTVVYRAR